MAEPAFQVGDQVRFHGLVAKHEDNGKTATIKSYDRVKGTYQVSVGWTSFPRNVKPKNIEKIPDAEKPKEAEVSERSPSKPKSESEVAKKRDPQRRKRSRSRSKSSRSRKRRRSRSRSRKRRSSSGEKEITKTTKIVTTTTRTTTTTTTTQVRVQPTVEEKGDRKGGKGGKGKGGKGAGKDRVTQISKALARVLRHTASSQGIQIRPDGYCNLEDLLKLQDFTGLSCSAAEVKAAVDSNDKKRFEIKEDSGQVLVRAVQGHSMKAVEDESLLQRLEAIDADLPTVCVHGTYRRCVESIKRSGLIAGGGVSERNHVHFAPFEPHDGRVISGMRYNCEVAIYINLKAAIQDGIPFFRSANQVILSPGKGGVIPSSFILKMKDLQTGAEL